MERLTMTDRWLAALLPDGWPVRTSTLITGPGGSGKPLIGSLVAASWLEQGGSVVFMSLQYPDPEFVISGLRKIAGLDVAAYADRIVYLELDTSLDGLEKPTGVRLRANLVKPWIWDEGIESACGLVPDRGPGVLVLGSALNLLLFSRSYGTTVLNRMMRTIRDDKRRTYLFSVSSTAKKEMIRQLENVADNLLVARSTRHPFRLFLRIERMRGVPFVPDEVEVPIAADALKELKEMADYSRRRVIPQVSAL
jgi:KaiC/GvpD/RAD55 family RecA-like ATPase